MYHNDLENGPRPYSTLKYREVVRIGIKINTPFRGLLKIFSFPSVRSLISAFVGQMDLPPVR